MPKNDDPIPAKYRPLLQQKARHEYGHLVSARIMGFQTGGVTLRLISSEGHHEATSEIMIHQPLRDTTEIVEYLERRIITLFSGAMAEADCAANVGDDYVELICFAGGGGAHDHGKIQELIGLHLNITKPDQMSDQGVIKERQRLYADLRAKSADLVAREYALIDTLAVQHANQLKVLNTGWGYHHEDIEAMPQIQARFGTASLSVAGGVGGAL